MHELIVKIMNAWLMINLSLETFKTEDWQKLYCK